MWVGFLYTLVIMLFPEGLGKESRNRIAPCSFGDSIVNFMLGSIEFKCASSELLVPFLMMVSTSSTYLTQVLMVNNIGSSGPKALFSKYSIYMLATTGEHREPIAAL